MLELSSVREYVVELLVLFCCVVCCFVVVLFFEERVCRYQLVLGCPMPEPLSSAVLRAKWWCFDELGVDGAMFATFMCVVRGVLLVVRSNLRVEVYSNQHVCVVCVRLPASVGVFVEI